MNYTNQSTEATPTRPNLDSVSATTRHSVEVFLHLRTRELAILAGRKPLDITQKDYEQAKLEVTGESDPARQNEILYPDDWARAVRSRGAKQDRTSPHRAK